MKLKRYDYIDARGNAVVDPIDIQERDDGEYYKADEVDVLLAPLREVWEKWGRIKVIDAYIHPNPSYMKDMTDGFYDAVKKVME